jgi:hypothetical protein
LAHFSIFANRIASTLTIEDTSSAFNVNTPGNVLISMVRDSGNVGIGTSTPSRQLHVESGGEAIYAHGVSGIGIHARSEQTWAGFFEGYVYFSRGITLTELAGGGSGNPLCRNGSNQISDCSSSLRYKTNVQPFAGGLKIINRLRPISFDWKQGGMHDIGLGAEEVLQVEPLLTFHNQKGEIEGVRYNQLSAVFINAFKEQQQQITFLQRQNAAMSTQLRVLEKKLRRMTGRASRSSR